MPRTSARRALDRLTLYGALVRPTVPSGVVFALLLQLETSIMLVRYPVIFVVTALMLNLEMSPMRTCVPGPVTPVLPTSRPRLLTEQTLRRGGGETSLMFGAVRWIPVTYGGIPVLGRRLFLLGPVFRVSPTRKLAVRMRQLEAMLKWVDVTRPTWSQCRGLPTWLLDLLFLLEPECVLTEPTVTVSALRVLRETELQSTVLAEKCPMTLEVGLILETLTGPWPAPNPTRLCRATRWPDALPTRREHPPNTRQLLWRADRRSRKTVLGLPRRLLLA